MSRIWFDRPAEEWNQALPIGNGRLGAMIFGGIEGELVQLNQDSVWYGGSLDRVNPDAKGHLDEVRKLILQGKIPEAEELLRYTFSGTPQSERCYQPLGNIELTFHAGKQSVSDYCRELDLDKGMVVESFTRNHVKIKKEYFASYPHGVIVIHMKAEKAVLSLDALLRRERFYSHAGKLDARTIFMDGCLGDGGVSFFTALRAETVGGTSQVLGEHLLIRGAQEITLFLCCETSYYEKEWKESAKKRLEQACKDGYECVKNKHEEDYRSLFERVELKIGEDSDASITERFEEAKKNGFDGAFAALYFQYGRYLLLSSSRPGSLPANLQGIWNNEMQPAWDSKYTININTEMNYWPAESCSLTECHIPLFDHLIRMWEQGKSVAQRMYGCRGFVAHHNTDLWGDCAPQDIYIPATYWVMGGAWLCTHIWTHYLYTQDVDFLQRMYPVWKDAVLFFHDYLIEIDGKLITCPSVSPENTYILPNGVRGCVCAGAAMDIQILRDLIEGYLKASKVLNICDDVVRKSEEILKKLPETKVGKYGQIMEWQEDYEEAEPGHRHISQLYALHPSNQITVDKTPKLAEAAARTLERRLFYGGGHTGWSCAWIVNLYARLGNSEKAFMNLEKLWQQSTFPNLMDTHPFREGYVFQIDGNFGATAAIAEMLVQSNEERVLILPALPKQWKDGYVKGLTVCGGACIDVGWENGKLVSCSLKSGKPLELELIYGEKRKHITIEGNVPCQVDFSE